MGPLMVKVQREMELMDCRHCQDRCVFAMSGRPRWCPNLSLGPCVHYLVPPHTSPQYFKHTHAHGGKGIIEVVTLNRLTRAIGTITLKDLRLTCSVKDIWRYGWMSACAHVCV